MLHGHLWVEPLPGYMEHVTANGHQYILHPLGSALVCLPFVAMGITDQRLISCLLGVVAALLCYQLTRSGWLTAFFVCGTTFLYEATLGASWNFCCIASCVFTFAALCELNRNERFLAHFRLDDSRVDYSRASLIGLWCVLAALCRYDLVLTWPAYAWVIYDSHCALNGNSRLSLNRLALAKIGVCGIFATIAGIVYVWYNYERFHTFWDGSMWLWYAQDTYRLQRPFGPLSYRYIPWALYTLFFMAPNYQGGFPWIRPQLMGQSLLSLSPAFLLARPSPYLAMAVLCSIPPLMWYASGFVQFGARYYVEAFPFLIASMRSSSQSPSAKALIAASMVLSISQTLIVWTWGLA